MPNFMIRDTSIKNPDTFKIERYNVTNMDRLANATMTGDLIARKLKFYFTYNSITSKDLDEILNVIWEADGLFFKLDYMENGIAKSAMVYVGSIPAELHSGNSSTNWVWKNVTFDLIEQ